MEDQTQASLIIQKAVPADYPRVLEFYWNLIEAFPLLQYSPKWTKDVYPTKEEIRTFIEKGELYYGEQDGMVVSAMCITTEQDQGYDKVSWSSGYQESEVNYLHLLGVAATTREQGIGRKMVEKSLAVATENGAKAMRLDVLEGNLPADKLYLSVGFQYVGRNLLYYEDTGWCYFRLYEKVL